MTGIGDDEEETGVTSRLRGWSERVRGHGAKKQRLGGSAVAGVSFGFERRYIIHRACTIVGSFINTNGVW